MRLHKIAPEYEGRVRLVERAFPLEVYGSGPADRQLLEAEIWLAALQEPEAVFRPFGDEWPTTTLPAFEAAWCAAQQGEQVGRDFDLRIRRAFFAEGRNIGRREVMFDLAREAGLDMAHFARRFDDGTARAAVLAEGKLGREKFGVRGTPLPMLGDGTRLRHQMAYPTIRNGRVMGIGKLPCYGEECYQATRELFELALSHAAQQDAPG
ncbi:MAG: hypothetical protein BWY52_01803 [Chloroflexi bacterium ADurb.Bin325]|nr:MAG: hypothetical protein BWY52_01803 [Chloroflexi bacterium ADurb.Bin325]